MNAETENTDRTARKDFGIWISIVSLAIGVSLSAIKAASAYGGLEQQVINGAIERAELKARLYAVEKQYSDFAVLKETVRNMDIKLYEIRQILQERKQR